MAAEDGVPDGDKDLVGLDFFMSLEPSAEGGDGTSATDNDRPKVEEQQPWFLVDGTQAKTNGECLQTAPVIDLVAGLFPFVGVDGVEEHAECREGDLLPHKSRPVEKILVPSMTQRNLLVLNPHCCNPLGFMQTLPGVSDGDLGARLGGGGIFGAGSNDLGGGFEFVEDLSDVLIVADSLSHGVGGRGGEGDGVVLGRKVGGEQSKGGEEATGQW